MCLNIDNIVFIVRQGQHLMVYVHYVTVLVLFLYEQKHTVGSCFFSKTFQWLALNKDEKRWQHSEIVKADVKDAIPWHCLNPITISGRLQDLS